MDYIKEAIDELREYNRLKDSLVNIAEEIQDVKCEMENVKAVTISDMPHGSGPTCPDDNLINKMYTVHKKQEEYKHTKHRIDRIDRILSSISQEKGCEQYGKVLKLWFIDKWEKADIATETGYTERHLYRIENWAIRKFAIELNGIDVIN